MIDAQNKLLGEVYTLAEHEKNFRRLKSGEITGEEWKAAYERLKASKQSIIAELSRKTLKQLAPRGGRRDKKVTAIVRIWEQMLQLSRVQQSTCFLPFQGDNRVRYAAVFKTKALTQPDSVIDS